MLLYSSYYNNLTEEEKCGAIAARNLTEAQIYTIGSAIDSQAALNTAYRNIATITQILKQELNTL